MNKLKPLKVKREYDLYIVGIDEDGDGDILKIIDTKKLKEARIKFTNWKKKNKSLFEDDYVKLRLIVAVKIGEFNL